MRGALPIPPGAAPKLRGLSPPTPSWIRAAEAHMPRVPESAGGEGGRSGARGCHYRPPMTSSDGKASHTEGTDGDGGWGAPAEDQDQTGTQQSVTDAGPRHPDSRCKIRGPQLTQHVERPDGVGLQRLDGVVHVAGRRGWRRQVVDLVHCGGKTTPVTSTENTERLNS